MGKLTFLPRRQPSTLRELLFAKFSVKVAGEAAEVPSKIFIALRIFIQPQPSFSNLFVAPVRNGLNNNEPDQMKCKEIETAAQVVKWCQNSFKFYNAYIESQINWKLLYIVRFRLGYINFQLCLRFAFIFSHPQGVTNDFNYV